MNNGNQIFLYFSSAGSNTLFYSYRAIFRGIILVFYNKREPNGSLYCGAVIQVEGKEKLLKKISSPVFWGGGKKMIQLL